MALVVAAMPVPKAQAPWPFSSAASFSSSTVTVGLFVRE